MSLFIPPKIPKKDFLDAVSSGKVPPLYAPVQWANPAEVYRAFAGKGSSLLESGKGPLKIARHSFAAFQPYMELVLRKGEVYLDTPMGRAVTAKPLLERLREIIAGYPQIAEHGLPPFQGGALGLFTYDFAEYVEDVRFKNPDELGIPDAHFFIYDRLIAFDHRDEKCWAIVCPGARMAELGHRRLNQIDWPKAYDEALGVLDSICERASRPLPAPEIQRPSVGAIRHGMDRESYMSIVEKAKQYIKAGDIYQANLSIRLSADIGDTPPWPLYSILRGINPSPFACFLDFGDYHIASSSPERLFLVHDGIIETRPIAGTRPRGKDFHEDEALRAELLLNEKERAEHIMLIDLERNDIGKVSSPGTVMVDELMITEDYSHVIHIVSNVRGTLAPGRDAFDSVKALFPGGTITGVPKVRCMEIIDELEPVRRGPYTGSAGYAGFSGSADFNIIIRTFTVKDGTAHVQAGAGIVADSDPSREYDECMKKAEALMRTLDK